MKVLYFAWLRENLGLSTEDIEPPGNVTTVADLISWLQARSPRHNAAFAAANNIRCAVDQDFCTPDASIARAREVAFFPPVTGG